MTLAIASIAAGAVTLISSLSSDSDTVSASQSEVTESMSATFMMKSAV